MKRYLAGALLLLLLAIAAPLRADEHPARPGRPSDANITGHVVDARTGTPARASTWPTPP